MFCECECEHPRLGVNACEEFMLRLGSVVRSCILIVCTWFSMSSQCRHSWWRNCLVQGCAEAWVFVKVCVYVCSMCARMYVYVCTCMYVLVCDFANFHCSACICMYVYVHIHGYRRASPIQSNTCYIHTNCLHVLYMHICKCTYTYISRCCMCT